VVLYGVKRREEAEEGGEYPGPDQAEVEQWWVPDSEADEEASETVASPTRISPAGSAEPGSATRATPQCPICLEELQKIESRHTCVMVPCGHVLCTVCARRIKAPPCCPVCRAEVLMAVRKVRFRREEVELAEPYACGEPYGGRESEEASPTTRRVCVCPNCQKKVGKDAPEGEDGSTTVLAPCGHAFCADCGDAMDKCTVCDQDVVSRVSRVFFGDL